MIKFVLDALGALLVITALLIIGEKKWWGWIFSLSAAVVYFFIGIVVGLYFLIGLNIILVCVYTRNLIKWKREAGEKMDLKACDICMEIKGTQRFEIPIALTVETVRGLSKDHQFKTASIDLCPAHLRDAMELMLKTVEELAGEPHKLGKPIWDWFKKEQAKRSEA